MPRQMRYLAAQIVLIATILASSWLLVYFTNGTSEAYVYSFFIAVIYGAWAWGELGGCIIGFVAGIMLGPLMPLSVHPHQMQTTANWLIRTGAYIAIGLIIGYLLERSRRQQKHILADASTMERSSTDLILALAHTIELRDVYTYGHCQRVAEVSCQIGRQSGMSESELRDLYRSALIHDVGKLAIPESILNKPGTLTDLEYSVIQQHPSLGEWVLSQTENGHLYRDGVVAHHERWDGKGYPHGLSGDQIPIQGRIIAIADTFDAISSDRSYRSKMPYDQRVQIMKEGRGIQFDPKLLDIFLDILNSNDPHSAAWRTSCGCGPEVEQENATS